ncbi:MAG: hypothetical protein P4L31_04050 [Candidatus Babeliales bacterium]|nr:hypothetical protein [Candidatus Babeliales bacterium]
MKIIKNILILAYALALAAPLQSKGCLSANKVVALSAIGMGILTVAPSYYQRWCQHSLDNALFECLANCPQMGNFKAIKKCLKDGANINSEKTYLKTPLYQAIMLDPKAFSKLDDHQRLIKLLLHHGALSTDECKRAARGLLDNAIMNKNSQASMNENEERERHYYLMYQLINPEFSIFLIRYAMNLDPQIKRLNARLWNHLHKGSAEGVATCLTYGADPNHKQSGITPLEATFSMNILSDGPLKHINTQIKIINVLLGNGAHDFNNLAYKKAYDLCVRHDQLAKNLSGNEQLMQWELASKYERIMVLLEANSRPDCSCPSSQEESKNSKNVSFSPTNEVRIF